MDTPSSRSLHLLCLCLSLFVSPWFPQVSGDACTLACDALFPISPFPVNILLSSLLSIPLTPSYFFSLSLSLIVIFDEVRRICGTDGEDHIVPLSALAGLPPPWSCYRDCMFIHSFIIHSFVNSLFIHCIFVYCLYICLYIYTFVYIFV